MSAFKLLKAKERINFAEELKKNRIEFAKIVVKRVQHRYRFNVNEVTREVAAFLFESTAKVISQFGNVEIDYQVRMQKHKLPKEMYYMYVCFFDFFEGKNKHIDTQGLGFYSLHLWDKFERKDVRGIFDNGEYEKFVDEVVEYFKELAC